MQTNRYIGAILMIAGTAIGAGMLALPVSTAAYGFFPSLVLLIICWLVATFTALLILEVNLWFKAESNIISMAKTTLGSAGQIVAWLTYLLLFYSLIAAYLSGMNDLITNSFESAFHIYVPGWIGCLILIVLVGGMIFWGTRSTDYLNRIFITGKALTYLALIVFVSKHIQPHLLTAYTLHKSWVALPVVVTSFGYQTVIPGLRIYLNNDVKKLRQAILIGSTIPLIIYFIWELLILGTVPLSGSEGLLSVLAAGQPATGLTNSLNHMLGHTAISTLFKVFSFFAIATSFIGVSFGLFGFLADGLNIKPTISGRWLTCILVFIPPLIFTLVYPKGFILALSYGGIFIAILLTLLPALMAWSGRYRQAISNGYRVMGGKPILVTTMLFSIIVIVSQFLPQ